MARTRTQIRQLTVQQLGLPFIEGTSDTGSGTVTSLIDTPDLSQFRDDALIGSWIYVSDGLDADINLRDLQITDSAQSTGTLTFIPEIAAVAGIRGRTYEVLPFSATAIHLPLPMAYHPLYLLLGERTTRIYLSS